jgi:hypothetical protein
LLIPNSSSVALLVVGIVLLIVGGVLLIVAAFQESTHWGTVCVLLPLAFIVFAAKHWDIAKRGVGLQLLGLVVLGLAVLLMSPAR